ncbi:hypothetical protein BQ8482_380184 [Mesorhizobium delmotii]|uniref:Uncharacterized protein n=1 Tax=Mesorhizobium delmotii TaxID=1631247 RepID=A0A2P9AS58_9HYPH|nr:hypothetical protein BQ8482_380184 [Mesorhizobium delmotii]
MSSDRFDAADILAMGIHPAVYRAKFRIAPFALQAGVAVLAGQRGEVVALWIGERVRHAAPVSPDIRERYCPPCVRNSWTSWNPTDAGRRPILPSSASNGPSSRLHARKK